MTKFLFWKKCDWCGNWSMFHIGWIKKVEKAEVEWICSQGMKQKLLTNVQKDYCNGACAEHKTYRLAGVQLQNKG